MMCSCGKRIPSDVAYCPYCGKPNTMYHGMTRNINTPPVFTPEIPEESSSKNSGCSGILLGFLIVIAGLLLGLVVFLIYSDMTLEELANHFGYSFLTCFPQASLGDFLPRGVL